MGRRVLTVALASFVLGAIVPFGAGTAAAKGGGSATRALCEDATVMRAGGGGVRFVDLARKWTALADRYPDADRRLLDAIALLDEGVVDRRTIDIRKLTRATGTIERVCGPVEFDAEITVRVLPTGGYDVREFTIPHGLVKLTLAADQQEIMVIGGRSAPLLIANPGVPAVGAVELSPGRYTIGSPVAQDREAGQLATVTVT